jgi:Spy/CpxP family protein refolding chaperone
MKSIVGIIGIATLALVGLSTPASAQGGRPCDIKSESCLAALHLTRPQERQVESYRATAFRQSLQLQAQIDRTENELRFLARMHRPNPNAIARKQAELRVLRDREQGIWLAYRVQVEAVLYPMQRATWARCSHRGPAPAVVAPVVRPVGPAWQAPPSRVVVVQTRSPRPMGRR